MRDYIVAIEQRLDVKYADLLKDLATVEQRNKLTVADEYPGFLDDYSRVLSDGSIKNCEDNNEADYEEQEDRYVNMELWLPRKDDGGLMHEIVKRYKLHDEGKAVGNMNNNPLLDTIAYEVEFSDDTTEFLTANIIANNLLAQVYEEGHHQMILDDIIYHIQDVNDIIKEDKFTVTMNGMK